MHIDIQSNPFALTDDLRDAVYSAAEDALGRRANKISRLTVRLIDINGPRGGADKVCRIHSDLGRASPLIVEATHADMYIAISAAFAKARRGVGARIKRKQGRMGRQAKRSLRDAILDSPTPVGALV